MSDPGIDLLCGQRLPASGSLLVASIGDYENAKDLFVLEGGDPELCYGYTSNMAVRRSVFDSLGLCLSVPRGANALFASYAMRLGRHQSVGGSPNRAFD
jgi:hypothetical protein